MNKIACFDIGGTFIKYGVLDVNGNILFKGKFPSPKNDCGTKIPIMIWDKTKELLNQYNLDTVSISTAGKVDSNEGKIIFASNNLPGYTGTELSKEIKLLTGLNCFVENDVNAAALGEYWKGAGIGLDNFLCMTIGTGIGSAIIIDGKLHKGVNGGAGEIGHMIIKEDGENCGCGSMGCYERYASTSALIREYKKIGGLSDKAVSGEYIINKVKEKDILAMKVYEQFLKHVVTGIVNITHILDLGTVIIGGGISEANELFFEELNKLFLKSVMPSYGEYTKIIGAKLGNDAGLVGACYIALQKLKRMEDV